MQNTLVLFVGRIRSCEKCVQLLMAGRDQRVYLLCAGAGGTAAILLGGLLAFKKVSVPASE